MFVNFCIESMLTIDNNNKKMSKENKKRKIFLIPVGGGYKRKKYITVQKDTLYCIQFLFMANNKNKIKFIREIFIHSRIYKRQTRILKLFNKIPYFYQNRRPSFHLNRRNNNFSIPDNKQAAKSHIHKNRKAFPSRKLEERQKGTETEVPFDACAFVQHLRGAKESLQCVTCGTGGFYTKGSPTCSGWNGRPTAWSAGEGRSKLLFCRNKLPRRRPNTRSFRIFARYGGTYKGNYNSRDIMQ